MRISLVMPSFNQGRFIGKALASALDGPDAADELIVLDNLSTDGTADVLTGLNTRYPDRLTVLRTADGGQAEALNRGFALTSGDLVGWLNADDVLADGALARMRALFAARPDLALAHGAARWIDAEGRDLGAYPVRPDGQTYDFREGCFVCQPSVLLRRAALQALGPPAGILDEGLETAMDLDLWLRAWARYPGKIGFVPEVQALQRLHDGAKTERLRATVFVESMQVLHRQGLGVPERWPLSYAEEVAAGTAPAEGWPSVHDAYGKVAGPAALAALDARIAVDPAFGALHSHPSASSRAR
ncbi:MAG: glycosyltransferase [Oceanibaculum nanhaiense]|uniref:glycosyltransferase n=1 Tax=Oceanibaculum nanhaiense TaxID=1909734 RepID=UPI0025A421FD|nr:glycosyltransferase [Oceanibaculum nanhaiense]MDM7945048.1 glycosyltransferase [Oceanibaculum nanhaiense]